MNALYHLYQKFTNQTTHNTLTSLICSQGTFGQSLLKSSSQGESVQAAKLKCFALITEKQVFEDDACRMMASLLSVVHNFAISKKPWKRGDKLEAQTAKLAQKSGIQELYFPDSSIRFILKSLKMLMFDQKRFDFSQVLSLAKDIARNLKTAGIEGESFSRGLLKNLIFPILALPQEYFDKFPASSKAEKFYRNTLTFLKYHNSPLALIALSRYDSNTVLENCWFQNKNCFSKNGDDEVEEILSENDVKIETELDSMHPQERMCSYVFSQDVAKDVLVTFYKNYLASDLEKLPRRVLNNNASEANSSLSHQAQLVSWRLNSEVLKDIPDILHEIYADAGKHHNVRRSLSMARLQSLKQESANMEDLVGNFNLNQYLDVTFDGSDWRQMVWLSESWREYRKVQKYDIRTKPF